MLYRSILVPVVILLCNLHLFAANPEKIQEIAGGDSVSFQQFIKKTEHDNHVIFYYKHEWIDTLRVPVSAINEDYRIALDNALKNTGIHYFVSGNQIFLTKNYKIKSISSKDILENGSILGESLVQDDIISYLEEQNNEREKNTIVEIGSPGKNISGNVVLSGTIREEETGEPLVGAVVYVEDLSNGVVTDLSGYYVINIPPGEHLITFKSMGKRDIRKQVMLHSSGSYDLQMSDAVFELRGVEIVADKYQNVAGLQMGLDRVDVKDLKQIPTAMGETDVLKSALLLPGVQTVGESASGFNVRGGSTDQNLILFNGAPVYNSSHLFGFFSAFNADVVKEFKLYKSGIPAKYGGRISSVFDISTKNGNRKRFTANGGISPITGRLTVEGPLLREKSSFIISGRSTYSDWILKRIDNIAIRNSEASFNDLSARMNYEIDNNNSVEINGYMSNDYFRLNKDTSFNYTNRNATISYKHIFNEKLFATTTGIYSDYQYVIGTNEDYFTSFDLDYRIQHKEVRTDFNYYPGSRHVMGFGADFVFFNLDPGSRVPTRSESIVIPKYLEQEKASESSLYIDEEFTLTDRITLYGGLRYSLYLFLGPKNVYSYADNLPREPHNVTDSSFFGNNEIIQHYGGPEPRFSLRYKINENNSVKLSYNRMQQFMHMLSNTTAMSPTDTWKLSDNNIRPQKGDQYAIGYYKDFSGQSVELSLEAYYKDIKDIIEYKDGAKLLLNEKIETDLINAKGKAYGIEFLLKRTSGRLNGWLSYTYSRTFIKTLSDFGYETINHGEYYPAGFDKPHDLSVVGNYKFSRRLSISSNFVYSTGRPITYPVAKYSFNNSVYLHYSNRNEYRIPDYLRWDVSINLDGNLKSSKFWHGSWALSVYNLTGRDNAYSVYFISKGKDVQGYKLSVFSQPVVTLTYNFRINNL